MELPTGRPERIPDIFGLNFSAMKLRDKTKITTDMDFIIKSSIIYPLKG
jgi:hypothetical protein